MSCPRNRQSNEEGCPMPLQTKDLDPRFVSRMQQIEKDLVSQQGTPSFEQTWLWIVEAVSQGEATSVGADGHAFGYLQVSDLYGPGANHPARDLLNPDTNALLGGTAIAAAYAKAVRQGLSGQRLLDYVWEESGYQAGHVVVVDKVAGYWKAPSAEPAPEADDQPPASAQAPAPAAQAAAQPEL